MLKMIGAVRDALLSAEPNLSIVVTIVANVLYYGLAGVAIFFFALLSLDCAVGTRRFLVFAIRIRLAICAVVMFLTAVSVYYARIGVAAIAIDLLLSVTGALIVFVGACDLAHMKLVDFINAWRNWYAGRHVEATITAQSLRISVLEDNLAQLRQRFMLSAGIDALLQRAMSKARSFVRLGSCSICEEERTPLSAMVPCGHVLLCVSCANACDLQRCPYCQGAVERSVRLFDVGDADCSHDDKSTPRRETRNSRRNRNKNKNK